MSETLNLMSRRSARENSEKQRTSPESAESSGRSPSVRGKTKRAAPMVLPVGGM
jgi:hypothetical protein